MDKVILLFPLTPHSSISSFKPHANEHYLSTHIQSDVNFPKYYSYT